MKRLTTEEFIERSRKVHGDKYDYAKTVYTKSSEKVCVTCREHGDFWQTASSHLMGAGCPECGKDVARNARIDLTKEEFIKKSVETHDIRYDYSKVVIRGKNRKVTIICPIHGEFEQIAIIHMNGGKCPRCRYDENGRKLSMGWDGFLERARKKHGDKYIYPDVFEYRNNHDKIPIKCRKHGVFWQDAAGHLAGHGCPECDKETHGNKSLDQAYLLGNFKNRATEIHGGKYDYSKVTYYTNNTTKIPIICPKHGIFMQCPANHLNGQGCPKCGDESSSEKRLMGVEEFKRRATLIHGGKYDYSSVCFKKTSEEVTIGCPKHGYFRQTAENHLTGNGCPNCGHTVSKGEKELSDFIKGLGFDIVRNDRNLISPYEIDILVPELKIGIEYNGLRWHSELFESQKMMLEKTELCEKIQYRMIHIFEDEWFKNKDVVKSMLRHIFKKDERKIYARQCDIKDITPRTCGDFIEKNHLQGNAGASFHYGLFLKNELVAVMTFSKNRSNIGRRNEEGAYELLRFCVKTGTSVIGGASKLLKHFVRTEHPKKIITYADRRWSQGKLYDSLGFTFVRNSKPGYFYVVGKKRENRFKYRKDRLVAEGYDPSKSEHEIMMERGIYRIYDCGAMVFELVPKN